MSMIKKSKKTEISHVKIVQDGDPVLRELAQPVHVKDITSPKIVKIIDDMKTALASQDDGVAIAAPQIAVPLQIFVVSGVVLDSALEKMRYNKEDLQKKKSEDMVFINPVITKLSREKSEMEEGCLSVRYLYGKIKRSTKATIRAYNERGEKIERGASGLLAEIFQHETDHLNGVLFTDKAYDIQEILPDHPQR
jgi:peptide deformylase